LRTVYNQTGQEVLLKVLPIDSFDLPIEDISSLPTKEQQERISAELVKETQKGFDLTKDLMLRLRLLRLSKESHVLLFCMHHIASDGWSIGVLVKELGEAYGALAAGRPVDLPSLSIQYTDYAHWQRNYLQGKVLSKYQSYWEEQLASLPVLHELPLDKVRPNIRDGKGSRFHVVLPKELSSSLQGLAHQHDCTLFMVLQSAFSVFMGRHGGSEDVVMGTPIANREQSEVSDLIGFFVNTLVLRSDLSGNPKFTELLLRNKKMLLEAYAHQQMPFEQLVEVLQPERSMGHSPLFQVMFVLQNNEAQALELPGLELNTLETHAATSKFDLTLSVSETKWGIACNWEYATSLFNESTIETFARRFELLLQGIVSNKETRLFELPLLIQSEKQQLQLWNRTQIEYPSDKCVHALYKLR